MLRGTAFGARPAHGASALDCPAVVRVGGAVYLSHAGQRGLASAVLLDAAAAQHRAGAARREGHHRAAPADPGYGAMLLSRWALLGLLLAGCATASRSPQQARLDGCLAKT